MSQLTAELGATVAAMLEGLLWIFGKNTVIPHPEQIDLTNDSVLKKY